MATGASLFVDVCARIGAMGIAEADWPTFTHSITLGSNNTFTDWHMLPVERPHIAPPEPKLITVSVPGSDFVLDYTDSFDGKVHYNNRTGSWEFIVVPDGVNMMTRKRRVLAAIQGKWVTIVLGDDTEHTYKGRVWLSEWRSGNNYSTCTFEYSIQPLTTSSQF